ncbi:flagellar biosynthesis protein FlhF [Hydrocarboniphaga sp.]|uniref:flagellar biosynthesis protein FlhF n=1 Tax=Hydrocarboniphaga sp. TaxID=2033016 RepID=UPI003D105A63
MKIKRFQANTMREAIRLVREEQGADAVILSNRRIPGGVEVVAATDYDAALIQSAAQRSAHAAETAPAPSQPAAKVEDRIAASERIEARRTFDTPPSPPRQPAGNMPVSVPQPEPLSVVAAASVIGTEQLNREIQTLRALLEEQLAGLRWGDMQKHRPRQAAALRALANLGIEPDLARSIAEELPESSDPERARFLPLGLLSRRLPINATDPILEGGVIALVGPTGVGKTTTIAKLAARYAAAHGVRDIALVTADHYRIGAQEQLYTYARLLGVPVHAIGPKDNLPQLLSRLSDRKLVLVDSAGLSQHDGLLAGQIEQLKLCGPQLKTWLVIAGNAQPGAQAETVQRFGQVGLDGCVLSKIDEAHRIGGALSVVMRANLRVTYLCDGQRVPEDLHAARADRLVLHATQLARQSAATIDESLLIAGFSSATGNSAANHANV